MILDEDIRLAPRIFRTFLRLLVASLYRVEILGAENVPHTGPALFVSNHISYADPLVISSATAKPIRFLMWRSIFESKALGWFFRLMRAIPIALDDSPWKLVASLKEARQSLERGERVGLFAEGAISRFSQIRRFQRGMELIMRDLNIPIIPTHIDRMWGSIFSFERGRFIWKVPRLRRLPITVSFSPPLASTTPPYEVRQSVMESGSAAFGCRLKDNKPLHVAFLRQARKRWFAPCLLDASGKTLLSYGRLATDAVLLSRHLRKFLCRDTAIGVLLPASPSCTLSILALLFAGKTPVPLNPDLSNKELKSLCLASGVSQIVTLREIHEKFNFTFQDRAVYLDEFPIVSRIKRVAMSLVLFLLPRKFSLSSEIAGIFFSPAAESPPVPVRLTHYTITASLLGLQEVLSIGSKDTVASSLSVADSLLFTVAFWWPLLEGAKIKFIGETILVEHRFTLTRNELNSSQRKGTPFLTVYGCPGLPVICVSALDVREGTEDQRGGKMGTVGRPIPGISVRIVDPISGQKLPPRSPGLLLARSATISEGCGSNLADGWFITGDQAIYDEEGFVTIRRKETSINDGENVDLFFDKKIQPASDKNFPSTIQA